jgi:Protein of unknown function (DUF3617)
MDDVYPEDYVTKTFSIGFALLFCSTLPAADFSPLDVKTGQWETTMTGQTSGMPPIPDDVLNRMTPEQRAKVEAVMQARGGSKATVTKNCVTKDKLDKAFSLGDENTKSCSRSLVASSGNKQEIRIDCNRDGTKSTGTVKVEAADSENIKASMQMTVSNGAHTMNMNYVFASKWIGPVCSEK